MLALKKKREAEKKAAEDAAKAEAAAPSTTSDVTPASGDAAAPSGDSAPAGGQVSLFGIGGQKKTKKGDQTPGTKKTPGEIRIQKGNCFIRIKDLLLY